MPANSWEQLIEAWSPRLRQAFLEAIRDIRDGAQIGQIAARLEAGDVDGALRAVGLDPVAFRAVDRALEQAFEDGGNTTIQRLPVTRDLTGLQVRVNFNVRNPTAEAWLRNRSSRLVSGVLDDQRDMIREWLTRGMERGLNSRSVALDLVGRIGPSGSREGGVIGLTGSQAQWVRKYAEELAGEDPTAALSRALRDKRFDATVRRYAAEGRPIPAATISKMVTAYRNRALRYRGEMIGRTEALASLHQAQEEAINQAVGGGAVARSAMTFIWRTARDKRVRDTHWIMNGDVVRMGEPFVTGSGARLRFPGDPLGPAHEVINCRCWREPRVDFLAGIR